MDTLLGIDLGTTGIKAAVCSAGGDVLGEAYLECPLIKPSLGVVEQDAELWWTLTQEAVRRALQASQVPGATVRALSVSSQGISFVPVDAQTTARLLAVWGSSADDVWAVGARGTIRHYKTGALRFDVVDSPVTVALRSVWGSGPNDVWAVGDAGTVIHFDGAAWTVSTTGLGPNEQVNLTGVWGSGPDDVWAVGGTTALHFTGGRK